MFTNSEKKKGNIKCFSNTCKTHYRYIISIYKCVCESDFSVSDICISTHTHTHILQTSNALSPQQRRVQTRARQKQTVNVGKRGNRTTLRERWEWSVYMCVCVCLSKWVAPGKRGQFFLTRLDYNTHSHTHIYNKRLLPYAQGDKNQWVKQV